MDVLLVHEYYRSSSPSGEDMVFEREKKLLEQHKINVKCISYKNDDIGTERGPSVIQTAIYTPWSPVGKSLIKDAIGKYHPDIVHFHNTFPIISQSAIIEAKKLGVATVQTFHNFRSVCAQAMLMRDGICEDCLGRFPLPALIHRCYRDSFWATLPLFFNIALHRYLGTWQKYVDRFIVLSDFNRQKFIHAGFPETKIRIKPNFFESDNKINFTAKKTDEWLFIGRLKDEKGIQFLPEVWKRLGEYAPLLHVLGDGPLFPVLKNRVNQLELADKIIFHGHASSSTVLKRLMSASLLVFPSVWYEGFPLVIGEAYAAGVAVAASKLGTPAAVVKDGITGIHFEPGNVEDMANRFLYLRNNPPLLKQMGINARREYEKYYTPDANFEMIMQIYKEAIGENRHPKEQKQK